MARFWLPSVAKPAESAICRGGTAPHFAAHYVNAKDLDERTAMTLAIRNGHLAIIKLLRNAKALDTPPTGGHFMS